MKKTCIVCILLSLLPSTVHADGFTVTSSGEAIIYGYYNDLNATSGLGLSGSAKIDTVKHLEDGTQIGGYIDFATPDQLTAYLYYKSSLGDVRAGILAVSDRDVNVPTSPDTLDSDFAQTIFGNLANVNVVGLSMPILDPAITYSSERFAGFALGLGTNLSTFDAVIAGSFDTGAATVKVGVGYVAGYSAIDQGKVSFGANISMADVQVGSKLTHDLTAGATATGGELGGKITTGSVSYAVKYQLDDINLPGAGTTTAGTNFTMGNILLGANMKHDNSLAGSTNKFTANAGAKYTLGSVTLGTWGEYRIDDSTFAVNSGIDYQLNDNISLGAGVSYNHSQQVGGAAGVKVKF